LREEAEGREKVVWGSVDGWRDAQLRREDGDGECAALGGGTLPGVDDRPASREVDGVGVGDGNVGELVDEGVVAGVSAHGLTHGRKDV
jgi:hypothetical protein